MGIIDEKGRLFGKINVIDFLVVLFLLCVMPAFYFGYKIMTKKPQEIPKREFIEIELDCRFIKIKPEILPLISVDDKELDENGQVIGEIIGLGEQSPYRYKFNIGPGEEILKEDAILKQIKVRLKLKAGVKKNGLYYKDKLVKIGAPLEFKTNEYRFAVIPFKEEGIITLKVKFSNLMPEIASVTKSGDKQIEISEDNSKKVISKINKIISDEPAEYISLVPGEKSWSIVGHPKNRDLVLEIEVLCVRKPQGLFLKNNPVKAVKAGMPFEFSTDLYSISGTIVGLEIR